MCLGEFYLHNIEWETEYSNFSWEREYLLQTEKSFSVNYSNS